MKSRLKEYFLSLIIFAIIAAVFHYLVFRVLPDNYKVKGVIDMHLFLFVLTMINHVVMLIILKKKPDLMGYSFMGFSFLKMVLCVLFLLPVITNKTDQSIPYVLQFFTLYFGYLFYEVVLLLKELKNQK